MQMQPLGFIRYTHNTFIDGYMYSKQSNPMSAAIKSHKTRQVRMTRLLLQASRLIPLKRAGLKHTNKHTHTADSQVGGCLTGRPAHNTGVQASGA
jgi:hypothetical protein